MKINRKKFFDTYRSNFGKLTQPLVDNLNFWLSKLETGRFKLPRQMGYMLATGYLETAYSFAPVVEGYYLKLSDFARLKTLYKYYSENNRSALRTIFPNVKKDGNGKIIDFGKTYEGRGDVQITHDFNYDKFGIKDTPEKALEPETAFMIMEKGMANGMFTGHKLQDHINENKNDTKNARRVINGLNEWKRIANYADIFTSAIELVSDEVAMEGYSEADYI
jgi:ribosomal protein S15P/S13E